MSESSSSPPLTHHATRLLVVDDVQICQVVFRKLLEDLGYAVDVASSGKDAVRAAESTDYQLIFMDLQMPDMDGYEACRWIRSFEVESRRQVPIIAMTASAEGEAEWSRIFVSCIMAGMDDCLSKPPEKAAVLSAIAAWSRSGQSPVQNRSHRQS